MCVCWGKGGGDSKHLSSVCLQLYHQTTSMAVYKSVPAWWGCLQKCFQTVAFLTWGLVGILCRFSVKPMLVRVTPTVTAVAQTSRWCKTRNQTDSSSSFHVVPLLGPLSTRCIRLISNCPFDLEWHSSKLIYHEPSLFLSKHTILSFIFYGFCFCKAAR